MTPSSESNKYALSIGTRGFILDEEVNKNKRYRISFYLNDNIKIKNVSTADGTDSNPYELSN